MSSGVAMIPLAEEFFKVEYTCSGKTELLFLIYHLDYIEGAPGFIKYT